jgi:Methyltransferase domain
MGTSLNNCMTLDLTTYYQSLGFRSAWEENHAFANWLVQRKNPVCTVELGVDYGYSLFALSEYNNGHVFGIDLFMGDAHAGERDWASQYKSVVDFIIENKLHRTHVIRGDFAEVATGWVAGIDILHIDGLHTYEAVAQDWANWAPKLNEKAVVLLHDTCSFEGPRELLKEIKTSIANISVGNFLNAAGLGVVTFDRDLMQEIKDNFANFDTLELVPSTGVEPAEPSPSN